MTTLSKPTSPDVSNSEQLKVNFNPQAEDCYFYFYSKCTKVQHRHMCYLNDKKMFTT